MIRILFLAAAVGVHAPYTAVTVNPGQSVWITAGANGSVTTMSNASSGIWSLGPIKPSDVGKCLISENYPMNWRIAKCR